MKIDTTKCLQWANERGLLGENADTSKQFQKLSSECNELNDALNKGNIGEAFLEFGDVLVTMIIYTNQKGLDFQNIFTDSIKSKGIIGDGLALIYYLGEASSNQRAFPFYSQVASNTLSRILSICISLAPQFDPQRALDAAVEKITNRKTTIINGTAVKESDIQKETWKSTNYLSE